MKGVRQLQVRVVKNRMTAAADDHERLVVEKELLERTRSTNDAPRSKVAERVMCVSKAGQRRSAGIFQGICAS
ncbi:hypothetical protein BG58_30780 [Caballeronia jiangsuensis]|nr:hypothetical protein BG58_30780 [Caballeronia jiangsuensis]